MCDSVHAVNEAALCKNTCIAKSVPDEHRADSASGPSNVDPVSQTGIVDTKPKGSAASALPAELVIQIASETDAVTFLECFKVSRVWRLLLQNDLQLLCIQLHRLCNSLTQRLNARYDLYQLILKEVTDLRDIFTDDIIERPTWNDFDEFRRFVYRKCGGDSKETAPLVLAQRLRKVLKTMVGLHTRTSTIEFTVKTEETSQSASNFLNGTTPRVGSKSSHVNMQQTIRANAINPDILYGVQRPHENSKSVFHKIFLSEDVRLPIIGVLTSDAEHPGQMVLYFYFTMAPESIDQLHTDIHGDWGPFDLQSVGKLVISGDTGKPYASNRIAAPPKKEKAKLKRRFIDTLLQCFAKKAEETLTLPVDFSVKDVVFLEGGNIPSHPGSVKVSIGILYEYPLCDPKSKSGQPTMKRSCVELWSLAFSPRRDSSWVSSGGRRPDVNTRENPSSSELSLVERIEDSNLMIQATAFTELKAFTTQSNVNSLYPQITHLKLKWAYEWTEDGPDGCYLGRATYRLILLLTTTAGREFRVIGHPERGSVLFENISHQAGDQTPLPVDNRKVTFGVSYLRFGVPTAAEKRAGTFKQALKTHISRNNNVDPIFSRFERLAGLRDIDVLYSKNNLMSWNALNGTEVDGTALQNILDNGWWLWDGVLQKIEGIETYKGTILRPYPRLAKRSSADGWVELSNPVPIYLYRDRYTHIYHVNYYEETKWLFALAQGRAPASQQRKGLGHGPGIYLVTFPSNLTMDTSTGLKNAAPNLKDRPEPKLGPNQGLHTVSVCNELAALTRFIPPCNSSASGKLLYAGVVISRTTAAAILSKCERERRTSQGWKHRHGGEYEQQEWNLFTGLPRHKNQHSPKMYVYRFVTAVYYEDVGEVWVYEGATPRADRGEKTQFRKWWGAEGNVDANRIRRQPDGSVEPRDDGIFGTRIYSVAMEGPNGGGVTAEVGGQEKQRSKYRVREMRMGHRKALWGDFVMLVIVVEEWSGEPGEGGKVREFVRQIRIDVVDWTRNCELWRFMQERERYAWKRNWVVDLEHKMGK